MSAKVTRVAITNYRSIGSCDVALEPLTLLVGPNGAGKSNFLDALRFVVHSMHAPLDQVIEARSGIRSILRKVAGGGQASSFTIRLAFEVADSTSGSYSLTIARSEEGGAVIQSESCEVNGARFDATPTSLSHNAHTTPASTGDRPTLVSFGALPQFAPVFNLLAGFGFYAPNPARMRRPTPPGSAKVLSRDASNAADLVSRFEQAHPETLARINGYLASFTPEFVRVTATETGNYRWLSFVPALHPQEWVMTSTDVSDGTLRALAILLATFQASVVSPPLSLVGLEEPESNLHPAAAGVLLDALVEASAAVPIVASTHSADLLDRKDLPDSALLAVALQDGETIIGPLNDSGKAILRQRLYTAGELMRSNQLNPAGLSSHSPGQ
jgi:predicted ATPase